jgi:hypothetical protein
MDASRFDNEELDSASLRGVVRTMQIVLLALILGVCGFAAYALINGPVNQQPIVGADTLPVISIVAGAMFVTNAVLSFVLPGIITQGALTRLLQELQGAANPEEVDVPAALVQSRQTSLVVAAALLEAAAMTATVAYLFEGHVWVLGIVAAAILLMLAQFPVEGRLRAWLDTQIQRLRDLLQATQARR